MENINALKIKLEEQDALMKAMHAYDKAALSSEVDTLRAHNNELQQQLLAVSKTNDLKVKNASVESQNLRSRIRVLELSEATLQSTLATTDARLAVCLIKLSIQLTFYR